MYENDKIRELKAKRSYIDSEIQKEIEKERSKYKFSWKRFSIMVGLIILMFTMVELNKRIFTPDSIWSWEHYFSK